MILIAQFLLVFMLFPFEISHWLYDSTILVSQVCFNPQKKKRKKEKNKRDLVKANKSKLHFFISLFYYHHFFGNKIDIFLNIPIFPSKLYIFLKFITVNFFFFWKRIWFVSRKRDWVAMDLWYIFLQRFEKGNC